MRKESGVFIQTFDTSRYLQALYTPCDTMLQLLSGFTGVQVLSIARSKRTAVVVKTKEEHVRGNQDEKVLHVCNLSCPPVVLVVQ